MQSEVYRASKLVDLYPFYKSTYSKTGDFISALSPSTTIVFKPNVTGYGVQPESKVVDNKQLLLSFVKFWNDNVTEKDVYEDKLLQTIVNTRTPARNEDEFVQWLNSRAHKSVRNCWIYKISPHLYCVSPIQSCKTCAENTKQKKNVNSEEGFYFSLGPNKSVPIPIGDDTRRVLNLYFQYFKEKFIILQDEDFAMFLYYALKQLPMLKKSSIEKKGTSTTEYKKWYERVNVSNPTLAKELPSPQIATTLISTN